MAQDVRPYKSKEQDGQGNEVIIRDQQLVEQGTTTTMPAGTYFQTLDVDGRPVKIPKDNMLNLIVEGLGIIFNGQSNQQTVTKVPTLNGNNFGASTVATLASVLGALMGIRSFILSQSWGTSVSVNVGYGMVVVGIKTYGTCTIYSLHNGNTDVVFGTAVSALTITRNSEYNVTFSIGDANITLLITVIGLEV